MPDEPQEKTTTSQTSTDKPEQDSGIKELVDAVTQHSDKVLEAVSSRLAPEKPDPQSTHAAEMQKYQERRAKAREEFDKLMSEGKWNEAVDALESVKPPPPPQDDPEKNPIVKATQRTVYERVTSEFSDLMEHFGDEAKAAINSLPVADRLDDDKVRDALRRVQGSHVNDLVSFGVEKRVQEEVERRRNLAPGNVPDPTLGEDHETELHSLSFSERKMARDLGVEYKAYADAKKRLETGGEKGLPGVEILSLEELP